MANKKGQIPANMHYNHKAIINVLIKLNGRIRVKTATKPVAPQHSSK